MEALRRDADRRDGIGRGHGSRHVVRLSCPVRVKEGRTNPPIAQLRIDRRSGIVECWEPYQRDHAVNTLSAIADWMLWQAAVARAREAQQAKLEQRAARRLGRGG